MNILAKSRNSSTRGARSALLATIVAWLGFLLQPCVMAATLTDSANSGDAVELSVVTHHGTAESCLHCVDADGAAASPVPGCLEASAAAQTNAAKGFDLGDDTSNSLAVTAPYPDVDFTRPRYTGAPGAEDLPRSVSLTVLNCVFLE